MTIRKIMPLLSADEKNRFESKFKKNKGCWIWEGTLNVNTGYGQVGVNGKLFAAHRLAYSIYKSKIPKNLNINHTCNNKKCINPKHLYAGTQKQNMQDKINTGRAKYGFNKGGNRGVDNNKSILTEEDVIEIRHCCLLGGRAIHIAEEYNVSSSAIDSVLHYKTWSYL